MGSETGTDTDGAEQPASGVRTPRQRGLLIAGLIVGVWASLPPFVGPHLNVAIAPEIVDHPVPAVVVLTVTALATRWDRTATDTWFVGGLVVLLAGIWQVATHVPLVTQALRGGAPWSATISHTLPTLVLFSLGAIWVLSHR